MAYALSSIRSGSLLAVCAVLTSLFCSAQDPAALDPSFNPGDLGNGAIQWYEQPYKLIVPLPDGRTLVGWTGAWDDPVPGGGSRIIRLDQNGWVDTTYHTDVTYSLIQMALQPDGKLLVAHDQYQSPQLLRLNSDGSHDTTFNATNAFSGGAIQSLNVLSNNDILVGGGFTSVNAVPQRFVARLAPDGTLLPAPYLTDPSIPAGTGIGNGYQDLAVLTDGRVVVCGFGGYARVLAFTPDGHYDAGMIFSQPWLSGLGNSHTLNLAATPDGGYLLCRYHDDTDLNECRKINADGTPDPAFQLVLQGSGDYQSMDIGFLPDGNILFTGGISRTATGRECNGLVVTDAQGNVQDNFPTDGLVRNFDPLAPLYDEIVGQAITADGRILLSSPQFSPARSAYGAGMIRLLGDGQLDPTFRRRTAANGPVNCAAIQPDGRIILGGSFTTYDGQPYRHLVRIHDDGSVDTTFHVGRGASEQVNAILLNPDGSLLVGIDCYSGSTVPEYYDRDSTASLFLLAPDGSFIRSLLAPPVTAFTCDTTLFGTLALERLPNGGVMAVGGGVARFGPDLMLDTTYHSGDALSGVKYDIHTIPDGRAYVGGSIHYYYSSPVAANLVRLNNAGTIDNWDGIHIAGTSDLTGQVLDLEPLASGSAFMVCGRIRRAYSTLKQGLMQVTTDGVITSFTSGFAYGSDDFCHRIRQLSNGDFLIGGRFMTYAGQPRNDLVRTNWLGVLDTTFNAQGGLEPETEYNVRVLDVDAFGRYLVAGDFQSYQGIGRNFVLRLTGTALATGVNAGPPAGSDAAYASVGPDGRLMLSPALATMDRIQVFDPLGRLVIQTDPRQNTAGIDVTGLTDGIYLVKGTRNNEVLSTRFLYHRQ